LLLYNTDGHADDIIPITIIVFQNKKMPPPSVLLNVVPFRKEQIDLLIEMYC
jgi:hypothetical protein